MAAAISKEATLSEVLAEVSILDVGAILKRSLAGLGCLAIFFLVVAGLDAGTTYALPDFHPPSWGIWLFWLAIGWGWLASVTEGKSYHHWEYGWYFPKLRWWHHCCSPYTSSEALSSF